MLSVTNLVGETEAISWISGFKLDEDTNSNLSVTFTSIYTPENPGHDLIQEESVIDVEGRDFRVKQLKEVRNRKEVTAISTFYDLKGNRQDTIFGGTRTFSEFATFILQNTGWTFTSVDVTDSRLIADFGNDNVVKLIEILCTVYECEFQILPGNKLIFKKELGGVSDEPYLYGHNVKSLSKKVDTTNLRTRIKGYGANGLEVTYTSPNHTKFGISDETPIRDEQFSTSESMTEQLKRTLIDNPEVSFEMDTIELVNRELGERVWLIYEPMGIEFQTRILSKSQGMREDHTLYNKSVVLGNTVPKPLTDILVSQKIEIDENVRETRSRFHQTNEKIALEVEKVDESIAALNIKSDSIVQSVTQVNKDVSAVSGAVARAEATISVQAGLISSKVEQTDFNGNTIVSMINQTPAYVSIEASKINLTGYVTISSLGTPGHVTIAEGNIVGSSFTVGRGTGNPQLSMYAIQGSHRIVSSDGAGFRVESTGTMSLKSGAGNPITMLGFTRVEGNLSVEPSGGGTPLLSTNLGQNKVAINGALEVTSIMVGGKSGVPALFT